MVLNLRVFTIALMVIVAFLASIFLLSIASGTSAKADSQVDPSAVNVASSINIDMPIYVVGPTTLVQGLINAGVNGSLIKLITINQLSTLPNGSAVLIDWSLIEQSLIINKSGIVQVNTNSIIFKLIERLINHDDLVIIHTTDVSKDFVIVETLALAWARAYNERVVVYPAISGYYVSVFEGRNALVFGSGYEAKDVVGMVNYYQGVIDVWRHKAEISQALSLGIYGPYGLQSALLTNIDPCQEYVQEASSLSGVVFDYQPYYGGVSTEAFSDGNGTFFYDACIFVFNGTGEPYKPAGAGPYYPVATAAWMAYVSSSTIINNDGYINYFIGTMDHNPGWFDYQNGYNSYLGIPVNSYLEYESGAKPVLSTSPNYVKSFTVNFGASGIVMALPVEYIESPSSTEIIYKNTAPTTNTAVVNNTWWFYMGGNQQANQAYMVAFAEDADEWVLPQGLNTQQKATFYNELGINLVTSIRDIPCTEWIYNYEIIWAKLLWVLQYNPGALSQVNHNVSMLSSQSPYAITGISSRTVYIPYICGG
ncbi:hypothetical protein VMUT_0442 [Vulcanisaeta moutnovskia 768-28]|uniref:Uncharacterized protein n=1 Tax=Vulcanisaeta moutnovskia (strain 768-28) TaxID=985053 RepID=F0QUB4_VULM7|nr:hypothetical protein [Vulcanisaeta moutnovskia]ADY00654.1 hypothetical protein VMUT_0442 [Vulcanisaeta moutnovskia 768-28]